MPTVRMRSAEQHCFTESCHVFQIRHARCTLVGRLSTGSTSTACQQSRRMPAQIKLSEHELAPRLVLLRLPRDWWQTSAWGACSGMNLSPMSATRRSKMGIVARSESHRTRSLSLSICNRSNFRNLATTKSEVASEGQGLDLMHHLSASTATSLLPVHPRRHRGRHWS